MEQINSDKKKINLCNSFYHVFYLVFICVHLWLNSFLADKV